MRERSLRIALVVSVIVNLFAIGAAGGAAVMLSAVKHEAAPAAHRRPLLAAADALPPPDQARFLDLMHRAQKDGRSLRLAAQAERRTAADLFVQPAFDAAEVGAALARARDADFALRARLETALVQAAATLPQSERASLAGGLAKGGPLRHPKARRGP